MRVDVYWNSHRRCYSIRRHGRVVAHAARVWVQNGRFLVSGAGRERALRDGRRNVHAFVRGELWSACDADGGAVVCGIPASYLEEHVEAFSCRTLVEYDARRAPHFTKVETGDVAVWGQMVECSTDEGGRALVASCFKPAGRITPAQKATYDEPESRV